MVPGGLEFFTQKSPPHEESLANGSAKNPNDDGTKNQVSASAWIRFIRLEVGLKWFMMVYSYLEKPIALLWQLGLAHVECLKHLHSKAPKHSVSTIFGQARCKSRKLCQRLVVFKVWCIFKQNRCVNMCDTYHFNSSHECGYCFVPTPFQLHLWSFGIKQCPPNLWVERQLSASTESLHRSDGPSKHSSFRGLPVTGHEDRL